MLTIDKRKFFTHKNNLPKLVEFAKTCHAEISMVKSNNIKVLELPELAKSICDHGIQKELPQYEVVVPQMKMNRRQKVLHHANIIHDYVKDNFIAGNIVSLSNLENEFKGFGLSKAALCNHITKVRKELADNGYSVTKVKRGAYRGHSATTNISGQQTMDTDQHCTTS